MDFRGMNTPLLFDLTRLGFLTALIVGLALPLF
jgi:hypothetical protein